MAIRLDMTAEPVWYELVPGVRILAEPFTSLFHSEVGKEFSDMELFDAAEDVLKVSDSEAALLWAKAVARRVIVEWDGVEGPDGEVAEISDAAIDKLMDICPIYDQFAMMFIAKFLLVDAEKNASAPLPSTSSAGAGKATAKGAKPRVRTAPSKPNAPKPSKAARSGR